MIVKTGANYQTEGGYIEASKNGTNVIVTIDGDNYNFKSDAYKVVSLYETRVGVVPEISSGPFSIALNRDGQKLSPVSFNLSNSGTAKVYAGEDVAIYFSIGGSTGITNPALAEGSRNTVVEKLSTTDARIYANGPDAVAIIKEGD